VQGHFQTADNYRVSHRLENKLKLKEEKDHVKKFKTNHETKLTNAWAKKLFIPYHIVTTMRMNLKLPEISMLTEF
jgi:hypothetical protein